MSFDNALNKITEILKSNYKIKQIFLFGSRAKGTAKPGSDIDISIKGDNLTLSDIFNLSLKIDELDLPYKVDIIDYDKISNVELKEHIDRVCVKLT